MSEGMRESAGVWPRLIRANLTKIRTLIRFSARPTKTGHKLRSRAKYMMTGVYPFVKTGKYSSLRVYHAGGLSPNFFVGGSEDGGLLQ
jgi:hypothetical protein